MTGDGAVRAISDLFARLRARRPTSSGPAAAEAARDPDPVFPTKAFRKFLACLASRESPALLDLGPVVGSNVTFFGERVGCKIFVEDLFADLDRFVRQGRVSVLPEFLAVRFPQPSESVAGILCWDLLDYLDRPSAYALARELTRLLRPGGALLGFFGTADAANTHYTKYVIVDDFNLRHRPYAAAQCKQRALLNRDIIKMFEGLLVSDSFLLKNNTREILFRKPALERKL